MKATKYIIGFLAGVIALASCDNIDYPDRFRETTGLPTIDFIRYANKDVIINQANMEEIICIVGDNLTSVHDLYFNDQPAILNPSYMTAKTLVVAVPKDMPVEQTDKIYLYNRAGDVVTYDFKVLPPAPKIFGMSNEWALPGETVTIRGNFLFPPLTVEFPGATPVELTAGNGSEISFAVPEDAQPGFIKVTTPSGTAQSVFQYKDSRNMLFDWDGTYGFAQGYGWRAGVVNGSYQMRRAPGDDAFDALDGNYIVFSHEFGSLGDWAEDEMSFDYWPGAEGSANPPLYSLPTFAQFIEKYGVAGLALKFEVLIPSSNPWTGVPMLLMFSDEASVSESNMNNSYFSDNDFPRYYWAPWATNGSYDTADKWVTVSFPLTDFNKTAGGDVCGTTFDKNFLHGLAFFAWDNGTPNSGTPGSPVIAIDNIRVVPIG